MRILEQDSVKDIQDVVQPVVQLLTLAQLNTSTKHPQPHILFFANRNDVRPFLYYKEVDVMLTTTTSYP